MGRSARKTVSSGVSGSLPIHRRVVSHEQQPLGWSGWIGVAVLTLVLAILIRTFIFQSYKIPSQSMLPTLRVGDHILVNKFSYGFFFPGSTQPHMTIQEPQRGDVVVFLRAENGKVSREYFIKRIVAIPGDEVAVKDFRVFVNGNKLLEEHRIRVDGEGLAGELSGRNYPATRLGSDEYFVLGDNRVNSEDSRQFGVVRRKQIQGKAFMIYWSWNAMFWPPEVRWARIGTRIQ